MKLKKATALVLCMLTTFSFAGCKSLPTSSANNVSATSSGKLIPEAGAAIKFRTSSSSDEEYAKEVAAKFKEKYGVSVTVETGGIYDTSKLSIEGPSGKGPDVFMCADDKTYDGIKQKLFLQFDDGIVTNLKSTLRPVAMDSVTSDNKVYGVPVSIETYVLFYNKKLVTGKPIATFEELATQAKAFNNKAQNKFWFLFDASTASPIYPMLSACGWNLFGKDGTDAAKPGFDTPEFEKGLEVLHKYHDIVPILASDLGNTDFLDTEFESGKTGYIMSGPWGVKTYRDAGVDIGVVSLPTYNGQQEKSFAFVQDAVVSAYTKYPKAAQLFAQYLVSSDSAQTLYTKADKITTLKDISKIKGLADDDVMMAIVDAFDKAVAMPKVTEISYFWTIAGDVGQPVFDGTMTAQVGAKKAMEEWNTYSKTK